MYNDFYSELYHYGIPGMQKGRRRWTNPDGTLTEAGKARYASDRRQQGARNLRNYESNIREATRRSSGPSSTYIREHSTSGKNRRAQMNSMNSQAALRMGPAASSYVTDSSHARTKGGLSTERATNASMKSQAARERAKAMGTTPYYNSVGLRPGSTRLKQGVSQVKQAFNRVGKVSDSYATQRAIDTNVNSKYYENKRNEQKTKKSMESQAKTRVSAKERHRINTNNQNESMKSQATLQRERYMNNINADKASRRRAEQSKQRYHEALTKSTNDAIDRYNEYDIIDRIQRKKANRRR